MRLGADRPTPTAGRHAAECLTAVAGDELTASTLAVDLGAAVAVQDVRPEFVKRPRVRHDGIASCTTSSSNSCSNVTSIRMRRKGHHMAHPRRARRELAAPRVGGQRGMFAEWLTLGLGQRWRRQSGRLVR